MSVGHKKINIGSWERKEHFTAYRNSVKCGFSLTVKLDISEVIAFVKARGYKFYPVMIYLITKAANQHAEFKMAMKAGELIVWDYIDPVYTVLHTDTETFSALTLSHSDSLMDFIDRYNELLHKNKNNKSFFPDKAPDNHLNISSLPWIHFDSFNLNIADFTDYFAPSFTIGKYQMEGNKILMPLAIQVHHAVCDGIHVAKLIDTLQEYSNTVQKF